MTSSDTSEFLARYKDRIGCSKFFGDDISELSRDDLLGLVGWMMDDKKQTVAMRDDHIRFLDSIAEARRKAFG